MGRVGKWAMGGWHWLRAAKPEAIAGLLIGLAALVAALSVFAETTRALWGEIVIDDAFITYRYADNWVKGIGPTWNLGDAPVEGYSTPLFVFLLAAGKLITRVPIDVLGPWLCLVFMLMLFGAFFWAALRMTRSPGWSLAGTAFLASHPSFAVWAMGGMETSLFMMLGVAVALTLHHALTVQTPRAWVWLSVALFLLALTRTEGGYAIIAVFVLVVLEWKPHWPRRVILACLAGLAGALLIHEAIRYAYYGLPLPLPVYKKGGAFLNEGQVLDFARYSVPLIGLYFIGLLRLEPGQTRNVLKWGLLAVVILLGVVIHAEGAMSSHNRYVLPAMPLIVLGAVVGLHQLSVWLGGGWVAISAIALFGFTQGRGMISITPHGPSVGQVLQYSTGVKRSHGELGKWLGRAVKDPNVLVVAGDCGVTPFYAGLRFIDVEGLNDPHIARKGYDADYVFGRNPELMVLRPANWDGPLINNPRLRQGYSLMRVFPGFYDLQVWRRNDYPLENVP